MSDTSTVACVQCGSAMPRSAPFCLVCGTPAASRTHAAVVAPPTPDLSWRPAPAEPPIPRSSVRRAEYGWRVLAWFMDYAITAVIGLAVTLPIASLGAIQMSPSGAIRISIGPLGTILIMLGWSLYPLVMLFLQAFRGFSLGMLACGIRVVDWATLRRPGLGRILIRDLVVFAGRLVFGIGELVVYLSPLWDSTRRLQGWHDKAARTWLIDVRRGPNTVTADPTRLVEDEWTPPGAPAESGAHPEPAPAPAVASGAVEPGLNSFAPPAGAGPQAAPAFAPSAGAEPQAVPSSFAPSAGAEPQAAPSSFAPSAGAEPQAGPPAFTSAAPAQPELTSFAPPAPPAQSAPGSFVPPAPAAPSAPPAPSAPAAPPVPPAPAAGPVVTGPARIGDPQPTTPVRFESFTPPPRPADEGLAAPLIDSIPGFSAPRPPAEVPPTAPQSPAAVAPTASGPDLESTRLADSAPLGRAAVAASFTLDSGEVFPITSGGVIGRDPVPTDGALAIRLPGDALSVSKTHLEFGIDGGTVWVLDRNSTNGSSIVDPRGFERVLASGRREVVGDGDRVRIGTRSFTVRSGLRSA